MAERKTQETDASVADFLAAIGHERRRREGRVIDEMMTRVTGAEGRMWGASMIGYGRYSYSYASGKAGELFLTGFAPRKQAISLYIMPGFSRYDDVLSQLGKHKTGRSCLYVNKLDDIDLNVLEKLVRLSVDFMREKYGVLPP